MAPTLTAHYEVYANTTNANALTTSSFTPADGEVIIVKMFTYDSSISMGVPTGGSLTYDAVKIVAAGGFNCWVGIYAATVGTSPGSMTVSSTPTGSCRHSMIVERWSGALLDATPATNTSDHGSSSAPSTTLTSTADNSIVSWVSGDESSRDPATRAYLSSATEDGLQDGHVGSNAVAYFAYQDAATAGSQTFGLSAPGSQTWSIAGLEILEGSSDQSITATGISSGSGFGTAQLNLQVSPSGVATAQGVGTPSLTYNQNISPSGIASGQGFGIPGMGAGYIPILAVQGQLNRIAGTTGLGSQGAANVIAGTTGLATVGALNTYMGNDISDWLDLPGVANQMAGTTGLGTALALSLVAPV